jgi:DNA polymerase III subunit delta'
MSVPDPRENPILLGHAGAEATIAEAMRGGRLHHAWLISGPDGVGKATLAFRFARRLLAGAPTGDDLALPDNHPVFRRVASGAHADLLTIAREWDDKRKRLRGEIIVNDVRKVANFLHLTPAEGGWRVVIVDGAEFLNRNAANGLLKVLEEPPPRAILLLVCSAPGLLLPTIRSRCRTLRLEPLPTDAVDTLLRGWRPDLSNANRARLAEMAEGCPGRAVTLADEDGLTLDGLVRDVLGALSRLQPGQGHDIADAVGRIEDGYSTFMDLLRGELAGAVRAAGRGRTTLPLAHRPLADWVEVWQGLGRLQAETERFNLDKRQALIQGLALLRGQ